MARTWISDLVKRAQAVGWDVKLTGKNHYVVTAGNGEVTTLPSTTGSYRAQKNAEAWMSRQGLEDAERAARADRLKRRAEAIAKDRDRVPATAAADPSTVDPPARRVSTEPGSLGYVDGVAIVERAPAMFTTPVMRGKMRAMEKGEELLLEDERIVYRCLEPAATVMHPDAQGDCFRTFDSVTGLRGHATFHKRTTMPKAPERPRKEQAELNGFTGEAVDVEPEPEPDAPDAPDVATESEPEPAPVPTLDERVRDVAARVKRARTALAVQLSNLDDLNATVLELAAAVETSALDPEIVRKAERYDELQRMFGDG